MDLVLVAVMVLILGVAMYVILDGFDLGIGILFPFAPAEADRDTMIATIAPVWDGNETWLVLGGVTLFSAFPLAYSILLPAWYLGVMLLLAALILRGVVFEFRPRALRKGPWNLAFFAGSFLAAFAQGVVLGSFVSGFEVVDGRYSGGAFDWLTPFSIMTGIAVVSGYALLGATRLIDKSTGGLQNWSYSVARPLALALLGFILLVSVWTPLQDEAVARRWFSLPNILYLSPIPLITALVGVWLWRSLSLRRERWPFILSVALFLLSYFGLAVSLWPYIVPRHLTFWDAASPEASLRFILIGVAILLPLVIGYTVHTYRLFRGKSSQHHGYH